MLTGNARTDIIVSDGVVGSRTKRSPIACRWSGLSAIAATMGFGFFSLASQSTLWFTIDEILEPTDECYSVSLFGFAIDIEDDLIAVGAILAETDEYFGGRCAVYRSDGWSWKLDAELYDDDLGELANFGSAVDVDADSDPQRVIVGARRADNYRGAAQVWEYDPDGDTWQLDETLWWPDDEEGDKFGYSAAIDGKYAVVGAPGTHYSGRVFIYTHSDSGWGEPAVLAGTHGGDQFGASIDLDTENNILVIGAPNHEVDEDHHGAAYVYDLEFWQGPPWHPTLEQVLKPEGTDHADDFARDVALYAYGGVVYDAVVVVGSPDDIIDGEVTGSAYVFEENDSEWEQVARLTGSVSEDWGGFGERVDVNETFVIVGAPWQQVEGMDRAGRFYVFDRDDYVEVADVREPAPDVDDYLGWDVALMDCTVVVGACGRESDRGIAYIYECAEISSTMAIDGLDCPFCSHAWSSDYVGPYAVGRGLIEEVPKAIVWERFEDRSWSCTILDDLGFGGRANAIDGSILDPESFIIGGLVQDAQGSSLAAIWDKDGPIWQLTTLPMPPTSMESSVSCICIEADPGAMCVAGGCATLNDGQHGVVWLSDLVFWQFSVLPNLQDGSKGKVNSLIVEDPEGQNIILVGQCKNDQGVMRPVRWRKAGESFQILPMPQLPNGGPSGSANSIIRHADGNIVILGQAEGPDGLEVPVQWKFVDSAWQPMPLATEVEPPLSGLTPLAMADRPWPGPIVGIGRNAADELRGVLWEPDYTGGRLHDLTGLLGGSPGDQIVLEAVAMGADWHIAANLVSARGLEGPVYPAILVPAGDEPDPCPADFDGDGDVGTADLLFLLGAWGTPDGDVDGDGDTDAVDLLALLGAWGECP